MFITFREVWDTFDTHDVRFGGYPKVVNISPPHPISPKVSVSCRAGRPCHLPSALSSQLTTVDGMVYKNKNGRRGLKRREQQ